MRTIEQENEILRKKIAELTNALRVAEQALKAYGFRYPNSKQLLAGYTNEGVMKIIQDTKI